jgi:hypothetical protein
MKKERRGREESLYIHMLALREELTEYTGI